jgi:hypothetical protein
MRRVRGSSRRLFECGGDGWRAGTGGNGQARRAGTKYFCCWGGPLWDLLESLKHHYVQETISLSANLCFTRRRFYFFGVE